MKAFVVIFVSYIGLIAAAEWSYDYETQWPGKCRIGTRQSPINIMTRDALVDKFGAHIRGPLLFSGYSHVQVKGANNGHTLKWSNVEGSQAPLLAGGPLRGNYTFLQFHLHWLSEHALDGMKYPLEIHMVHIKTGLTLEEALAREDGLAVVGVLCQVRTEKNSEHALAQIMPDVPFLVERSGPPAAATLIDMSRLFSPEPQSFYTYHGSLTTPDCQEVVTWIVMDKPLAISDTQYKLFSKVDVGGLDNYRSLQPVNRVVYRSAFTSCASQLVPSFLMFLGTLLNCFSNNLTSAVSKGFCILYNVKRKVFGGRAQQCYKAIN